MNEKDTLGLIKTSSFKDTSWTVSVCNTCNISYNWQLLES